MRFAAEQAGIGGVSPDGAASLARDDASRLTLALEPEAAAIAAVPGVSACTLRVSSYCHGHVVLRRSERSATLCPVGIE